MTTAPNDSGDRSETASGGPPSSVRIRQAEHADLLAVFRIEKASFSHPWPYEAFERFLGEPAFLVAVEGTEAAQAVLGYVVADQVPNHGRPIGHVKDIAVHPNRRGEGIGSSLLRRALAILDAGASGTVKLEVRAGNDGAKALYHRFGFRPFERRTRYYDDGEDAIVMVRDATVQE